jgi:hypothetical protein
MDYISKLIPKYFLDKEKKNMHVPSLLFGGLEDEGIDFDFSVLDRPFVNYNAGTSDLEVQYTKHLRHDALAQELFAFICFFSNVQKFQLNNYFCSYSPSLEGIPEEKQKKKLNQALKKLYRLRLIRRTFIPEHSSKERSIASYSLTVDGAKLAKHMKKRLGIQGKIYDPDKMYLGQNNVMYMIKRQWAIVDVFLAASTLESFVGFRNHLNHVGKKEPIALKESQCILTLKLVTGALCNMICYVALPRDAPYYNKVKVEQFKLLQQRYPEGKFPEFGEALNFLCFIVFTPAQAEQLVVDLGLNQENIPPILFIILEDMQQESVKDAFYYFEEGKVVLFGDNLASK